MKIKFKINSKTVINKSILKTLLNGIIINKPLTLSIALVEQEPSTFFATHVYLAESLNLADFIIKIAVPECSS